MARVLWLLALLGALGAFDTIYYHEWRGMLPARLPAMRPELALHVVRDFIYVVVFASLPWVAWHGLWVVALVALLASEIVITLADFVVEDHVRKPIGGLFAGERVTHALMGIVYGAMLAHLVPVLARWWSEPNGLVFAPVAVHPALRWGITIMAAGIGISGTRDLLAVLGRPPAGWPWQRRVARSQA